MKKKLWMSLPILLVSLVLTGCSGNGNKSSSDSKEARVMEQADISALDPSLITDVGALETVNNSQEGLYRMKSSTEVEPGIAKDIVNPSNNGKTYTFKLRPGLKWSNGDPLTAQDFVYAWRRTVAPSTKSPVAYMYLVIKNASQIEKGKMSPSKLGIKAINKTTLQVNLSRATPYFKYLCAGVPFLPQNKKTVEKYGKAYGTSSTRMVYDGPFVVQGWSPSTETWTLKKNPNYWDKNKVKLNKVKFVVTKNPQTALSLYTSGKLDNITLAGQQASQEKNNKGYLSYPSGEIDYIAYNFRNKALRNINIRKAISLTINRKSLVNNVLKNGAKVPTGIAPSDIAKNPSNGKDFAEENTVKQSTEFNPKLAQKYWKKGMSQLKAKKLSLKLVCYDVDSFRNTAEYVQSSAQKYLKGLSININVQPKVQAITTMQSKKGYDLGFSNWIASFPDLSEFFQLLDTGNANNAGNYSNSRFDYYYAQANGKDSMNPQKRYNDFLKAEEIASKDQAVIDINQGQTVRLNNPKLKGVAYAAAQGITLKNAYMTNK
ncbi:peptide ABC transporter substrate-binding protein [Lentilactobacillus parabuchneri]|nr:peptide ABC transporter substrate-binding protein [Lentilactobacillus parabuchneri]APR07106.1 Oligopeptide-binding protein OppA precursor [Lentilactobacillus parabuchneri]MBW0223407.1 peptide ABC transporter substrate-binding protein [Lentilactobacillus parabuchneri]MBW0246058.1 peptide ABC transporter substrate-binding protein [Lentilactobacillus parabuchneri]MBW0263469.1 peptide ABC transporter substrate-binding protein [Lentilactobacillus parabuchneri]MDG9737837.1 peptide ABC transporter